MKPSIVLIVLSFLLDNSLSDLKPDCKNYKRTTHNSFACVCTEAQPCDVIKGPVKTAKDVVTKWESSRDGPRLRRSTLQFGHNQAGNAKGKLHIKVDRDKKYQEIFGFGGSFTDCAAINIKKLGEKLGNQVLSDYFSKDGIEYNVGRIPIGASDFSTHAYSLDDSVGDKSLAHFSLTAEDLVYKIPTIKKAQSLATHDIRLFGSPWSAPGWIKNNSKLTNGGTIKGAVGSEYWQIYAKYFVKYLNAYKEHNITHWGITIQNEPDVLIGYSSMYLSAEMERDFLVKNLGPELEKSGWGPDKLKVMIWDSGTNNIKDWVKTVFADERARKYAAGTAVHWYDHGQINFLEDAHNLHPDKFILGTEATVCGGTHIGLWDTAEQYAQDILKDLLLHVVGWTDWNMVVDMKGGPNWVNNFCDAPIVADYDNHLYYRQPHFYAMAHFSKFLAPRTVRVDCTIVEQKETKAIAGAFRTAHNSTVVIVVNNEDTNVELVLEDREGRVVSYISPHSIQTYVYYD